MKTFKFSLVLRTRENTDVFITLDDNIYGIHSKRVNILYVLMSPAPFIYTELLTLQLKVILPIQSVIYGLSKQYCIYDTIKYHIRLSSNVLSSICLNGATNITSNSNNVNTISHTRLI